MKATTEMVLTDNLKTLNLSHMLRQLEPQLRQAREQSLDYSDFILSLTEIELEGRAENRLKRRLREAKFPLLKTLDTFDYQAAPGLDRRLLHQLASGAYISQHRNVIFLGKSGARARPTWPRAWAWRPAARASPPALSPAAAWPTNSWKHARGSP
jgi:DNA replication protein DnaC